VEIFLDTADVKEICDRFLSDWKKVPKLAA
jgi:hypothetical protein